MLALIVIIFSILLPTAITNNQINDTLKVSPLHVDVSNSFIENEIICLAKNIYFESRGLKTIEQVAVASVTMNRLSDKRYPNTVCDIVYQKTLTKTAMVAQFSWTLENRIIKDYCAWDKAKNIAFLAYTNRIKDPTRGATHFYSKIMLKKHKPVWARRKNGAYDFVSFEGQVYLKTKNKPRV